MKYLTKQAIKDMGKLLTTQLREAEELHVLASSNLSYTSPEWRHIKAVAIQTERTYYHMKNFAKIKLTSAEIEEAFPIKDHKRFRV